MDFLIKVPVKYLTNMPKINDVFLLYFLCCINCKILMKSYVQYPIYSAILNNTHQLYYIAHYYLHNTKIKLCFLDTKANLKVCAISKIYIMIPCCLSLSRKCIYK